MDKEQKKEVAVQVFDVEHWIDSQLAEMTPRIGLSELIDNAWEETLPNQKSLVSISINPRDKTLVFEQKNTQGMDAPRMQEFTLWGGIHKDPTKIKEHRLGGKLAILYLLSKRDGGVSIMSQPPESKVAYKMDIEKWWQKLSPDYEFPIEKIPTDQVETDGITRFTLSGINTELISNPWELADSLGLVYGPLIREGKVNITMKSFSPSGEKVESKEVLPVTIPFREGQFEVRSNVPAGKNPAGPRITVSWGLSDPDQRKREETIRRNVYGIKHISQIWGDRVYYYYHGRLLAVEPLSSLGIPGYTPRMTFESFVVAVDITSGWSPKTILKTSLRATAPETQDIRRKIVYFVKDDIARIVKESRGATTIPKQFQEKAKVASEAFSAVLNKIFENNIRLMAETFALPVSGSLYQSEEVSRVKGEASKKKKVPPSLPGTRGPIEKSRIEGQRKQEKSTWINPIPQFKLAFFPSIFPEAQVSIDENGGSIIELNCCSCPSVSMALQQRGKISMAEILRVGASTLYYEKWVRIHPKDSTKLWQGIQEDVANFLSKAAELKRI